MHIKEVKHSYKQHSHKRDVQSCDAKGGQCGAEQTALHALEHHHSLGTLF